MRRTGSDRDGTRARHLRRILRLLESQSARCAGRDTQLLPSSRMAKNLFAALKPPRKLMGPIRVPFRFQAAEVSQRAAEP